MNKKVIYLVLIVVVLMVLSSAYVVGGTQAYSRYQQVNIAKKKQCGDQASVHICVLVPKAIFSAYYPSYLAAQPQNTLFTVEYSSRTPITLFIHVTINEFTQTQMKSVNATATVQRAFFLPPLLKHGLDALIQDENTSLHVQITDTNKHLYYDNDNALTLHSRWLMQWTQENRLRIAAWVTPNDHAIEDLIQKAQGYLQNQPPPVPVGMVGYKEASPQQVRDEVDALYDALRLSYHIKYVQESVPYAGTSGDSNAVENIKLPKEILKQGSGMCIELTTLLAAAVERIGLHPEIVIVPGHAFLGVAVAENDTSIQYWDAVDINNNIAADSANVDANTTYVNYKTQHALVDTILISDARAAGVDSML
ncbi:MAG: hypothetical protein NVS4B11_04930 [Ktedonobacteraceae bacterium]